MARRPSTIFLPQPDGTHREVYTADRSPVIGTEERVSVALAGESYAVYRHTDHVRRQIGRIYRTPATGNRRRQGADMTFREIVRGGKLSAVATFMHSRSMDS